MDSYTEELQKQVRLLVPINGVPWIRETLGALGLGKVSQLSRAQAEKIVGKERTAAAKSAVKSRPERSPGPSTADLHPVCKTTKERLNLQVSWEDYACYRRRTTPGTLLGVVRDVPTGDRYKLYSKACGQPCVCDTWALKVS